MDPPRNQLRRLRSAGSLLLAHHERRLAALRAGFRGYGARRLRLEGEAEYPGICG